MLELALSLARQGYAIHPVRPDKRPYLASWPERATTDEDTLRQWWYGVYSDAYPGIACGPSGLVVFDIEGANKAQNGYAPEANAAALEIDQYPTLTVRTPSGGLHYYYRYDGEVDKAKLYVAEQVVGDRQAGAAYVMPPGVPGYSVERGGAVKALPDGLLEVGTKPTPSTKGKRDGVSAGERNEYLIAVVGGLRNWVDDLDELLELAHRRNERDCEPPLPADEVNYMVRKAWRRWNPQKLDDVLSTDEPTEAAPVKAASTDPEPLTEPFAKTDIGNSQRFTTRNGHRARFVHAWGRWITWDGTRWRPDTDGQAERWLVETLRHAAHVEPALHPDCDKDGCSKTWHPDCERVATSTWLEQSESRRRIQDALTLASTAPGMHVTPDDLDGRTDVLNCPNGMADLRTGQLVPHDPEAMCTLVTRTNYNPDAMSERFEDFLTEVFPDTIDTRGIVDTHMATYDDNGDLRNFVQRAFGYSLMGAPEREQCLFIHYGASASGKSTLLESFAYAIGEYGTSADVETVLARQRGQHPTDLAALRGRRVVDTSELDSGERLSESVVKRVTSGDRIKARFMRQDQFEYVPTWVLHVTTNHGFSLGAGGESVKRRVKVIPWTVSFAGKGADKMLRETLKAEAEALLAWAVKGAVEYHQRGQDLNMPQCAQDVGDELFQDADPVAAFCNDALIVTYNESHWAATDSLYAAFRTWWSESGRKGEPDMNKRAFGMALSRVEGMPGSQQRWVMGSNRRVRPGVRIVPEYTKELT